MDCEVEEGRIVVRRLDASAHLNLTNYVIAHLT